jgi:galactose-1-phosphate uridylyltransferase
MSDNSYKISDLIDELMRYAVSSHLVSDDDTVYTVNRLLELFEETEYAPS